MRWLAVFLAAVAASLGGFSPAGAAVSGAGVGPRHLSYLALGDSVPVWEGRQSYPYLVASHYRRQLPSLTVENLAQSGATSTSMRDGGQYRRALRFLARHRGQVALITLDIGGNDVLPCVRSTGVDRACLRAATSTMNANVTAMVSHLRAAAPGVALVGMNYYDPFLSNWLAGGASRRTARATVADLRRLDGALGADYGPGHTADVEHAFSSTALATRVASRWGRVPLAVDRACRWLDIVCRPGLPEGPGDDPNVAGERVVARAFEKVIGAVIPRATP
jgi:lysophospholipase L1-like esterase